MELFRNKSLLIITVLVAAITVAGCGGGSKKKKQVVGEQEVSVAGSVSVFSGFGIEPALSPLSTQLQQGALAKIYTMQPDGSGLVPASSVQPQPASSGVFKLEKVPTSENNMVLRVETSDGEPILGAILPPVYQSLGGIVVSPETDLESAIFMKLAADGIGDPGKARAGNVDITLVKDLVSSQFFFDVETPDGYDRDKAVEALLPAIRDAYKKYLYAAFSQGVSPDDAHVVSLTGTVLDNLVQLQLRREKGDVIAYREIQQFEETMGRAVAESGIVAADMNSLAAWKLIRAQSLRRAAACLSGDNSAPGCPAPVEYPNMNQYGKLLGEALAAESSIADIEGRVNYLFPAGNASGTRWMPAVEVVEKLLNIKGNVTEPFRRTATGMADDGISHDEINREKLTLSNFRDTLLSGVLGMEMGGVIKITAALHRESRPLSGAVNGFQVDRNLIETTHRQFIDSSKTALLPLKSAIRSRFTKLEESDILKLTWALGEIVVVTTVYDIPYDLLFTKDTDGDGVTDSAEQLMETDPADGGSAPARVLTNSPSSMLPDPPADSDEDGFFDVVETIVGTDPSNPASKPVPGEMVFCTQAQPTCLMPDAAGSEIPTASLSGTVIHNEKPVLAANVALYSEIPFSNKPPEFLSSAKSSADGSFSIENVKPGRYFVVAFVDADSDMKPGSGDAVGTIGGAYPTRIGFGPADTRAGIVVTMKGIIGQSKCGEGKVYDPVAGECAGSCSGGLVADELTGVCGCGGEQVFVAYEGACAAECPADTLFDAARNGCYCPEGTSEDIENKTCKCPEGMFLDEQLRICRCHTGLFYKEAMTCVQECPDTFTTNESEGACICPDGATFDQNTRTCRCMSGYMDSMITECVEFCSGGMKPDDTTRKCMCPENEVMDEDRGKCVCVPGMERNTEGACQNPATPTPSDETIETIQDNSDQPVEVDTDETPAASATGTSDVSATGTTDVGEPSDEEEQVVPDETEIEIEEASPGEREKRDTVPVEGKGRSSSR